MSLKAHHICLRDHITVVDGEAFPLGVLALREDAPATLSTLFSMIVPLLGSGDIVVCGEDPERRVFGRKLEDRLKREVRYE